MYSSILPATPASFQYLRAIAVHCSETSQAAMRPSVGSASAMARLLYPVNTPISRHCLAPISLTSNCMNCPCSGLICIIDMLSCAVSARRRLRMSGFRTECSTRYACSASESESVLLAIAYDNRAAMSDAERISIRHAADASSSRVRRSRNDWEPLAVPMLDPPAQKRRHAFRACFLGRRMLQKSQHINQHVGRPRSIDCCGEGLLGKLFTGRIQGDRQMQVVRGRHLQQSLQIDLARR